MPKRRLVIEIEENPSKGEEIAALQKVAAFFAEHPSYLKSLFTDSLVEWVDWKIGLDVSPDVWGEWMDERMRASKAITTRDDRARAAERIVTELKGELQATRRALETSGETANRFAAKLAEIREIVR